MRDNPDKPAIKAGRPSGAVIVHNPGLREHPRKFTDIPEDRGAILANIRRKLRGAQWLATRLQSLSRTSGSVDPQAIETLIWRIQQAAQDAREITP